MLRLRILLHSYWFWPSIGGIEKISDVLARGWSEAGHDVTVVSQTNSSIEQPTPYTVIRNPRLLELLSLVRSHDLIFSNGSATHFFPFAVLHSKPFVWTHQDYALLWDWQLSDITGRQFRLPKDATSAFSFLVASLRVLVRRIVSRFAQANIAISRNLDSRQPLPRQCIIYNPIDFRSFTIEDASESEKSVEASAATFTFLGRLIWEKGVEDLLMAFAKVNRLRLASNKSEVSLRIIGDGPERSHLEELTIALGIERQIEWFGFKTGADLIGLIRASGIFVLPSRWEEPMGIVALELMAAGKPLILPTRGGLSECAGDACLMFENGNVEQLAEIMADLCENTAKQESLIRSGLERVKYFKPETSINAYLQLFSDLIENARTGQH